MLYSGIAWAMGTAPGAAGGAGGASGAEGWVNFLPIALIVVVFYFFILRPQSKKAKEQKTFMDSLKRGDKIILNSGILGTISAIDDTRGVITLEIAKDTQIKIVKSAVSNFQKTDEEKKTS